MVFQSQGRAESLGESPMIWLGLSTYLGYQSAGRDWSGNQGDLQLQWKMSDGEASASFVPVVGKARLKVRGLSQRNTHMPF